MTPDQVRNIRSSAGLSQSDLARRLGVTATTVSLWETGRTSPAAAHRRRLEALGKEVRSPQLRSGFRPIQYLGSKMKVAHQICDLIETISGNNDAVADLFSGSGSVTSVLSSKRRTISVDIQCYAATLGDAIIRGRADASAELRSECFLQAFEAQQDRLTDLYRELVAVDDQALAAAAQGDGQLIDALITYGSVAAYKQRHNRSTPSNLRQSISAVVDRTSDAAGLLAIGNTTFFYGGVYFSVRQAIAIDALKESLKHVSQDAARLGSAVLLSVASELANTVGKQFAQPPRIIKSDGATQPLLLSRAIRDRNLSAWEAWGRWLSRWEEQVSRGSKGGRALNADVLTFVENDDECASFYADPPYTIDHYSRFYHVLETIALDDAPQLDTQRRAGAETVMRGLYRTGRHQSAFSVPSAVGTAFERLFDGVARGGRSLVLSYSPFDLEKGHRPRLLTLNEIIDLARGKFRRVEAVAVENHTHRKLNARVMNVKGPLIGETLIVCEV